MHGVSLKIRKIDLELRRELGVGRIGGAVPSHSLLTFKLSILTCNNLLLKGIPGRWNSVKPRGLPDNLLWGIILLDMLAPQTMSTPVFT